MKTIPASKLQTRVLALLNKSHDGSYDMAARLLQAMGLPANGAPKGHDARSANKLTDAELMALLPKADTAAEVATKAEAEAEKRREMNERRADAKAAAEQNWQKRQEREKQNAALRAAGYRWVKFEEEDREGFDAEYFMKNDAWVLVDRDGVAVNLEEALKAAGYYQGPGFLK